MRYFSSLEKVNFFLQYCSKYNIDHCYLVNFKVPGSSDVMNYASMEYYLSKYSYSGSKHDLDSFIDPMSKNYGVLFLLPEKYSSLPGYLSNFPSKVFFDTSALPSSRDELPPLIEETSINVSIHYPDGTYDKKVQLKY